MSHKWICKIYDNWNRESFYLTNEDVQPGFIWYNTDTIEHLAIQFETYNQAFDHLEKFYRFHSNRFSCLRIIAPNGVSKVMDFGFYQELRMINTKESLNLLDKVIKFDTPTTILY